MHWPCTHRGARVIGHVLGLIGAISIIYPPTNVAAEGSTNLYPSSAVGSRANLEWRSSMYGDRVYRRTLLKVYAQAGEYMLLGSSAVAVPDSPSKGDIRVYDPGRVTGQIGKQVVPTAPSFSCVAQRAQTGSATQGRISSRAAELAGPDTITNAPTAQPGKQVQGGYVPCFYQAQTSGIYDVVFLGPTGNFADTETNPTGSIEDVPDNYTAAQDTSIAVWDVTVRADLSATARMSGRLFSYYLGMFTGGNDRPISSAIHMVTPDGFRYRLNLRAMDPNGYMLYGNQVGFLDTDGTPLYHDVMSVATRLFEEQNQLVEIQGDVTIAPPEFPIFFDRPAPETLNALGIPLTPVVPQVSDLRFTGPTGSTMTFVGGGGTFSFTSTVGGSFELIVSADGVDRSATSPQNRVLRGTRDNGGVVTVAWDGRDNSGQFMPVSATTRALTQVKGGEMHFPFLDVENSIDGSPIVTLINPPNGVCPPITGGCRGGFYDDRGYRTANGTIVGTAVNGPLCPGNPGDPPDPLFSGPNGFDTLTMVRKFGFPSNGNPPTICAPDGGFGDKKGLDLWTYYPGNQVETTLSIVPPTAITLAGLSATPQVNGTLLRWQTTSEQDTWGFRIFRSSDGTRANAVPMTPTIILAQGRGTGGASYAWLDGDALPNSAATYWLQEVEISGATHEYGSVSTRSRAAGTAQMFMPLVSAGS